jgi:membrane-associated PAP2 superfamily phosphatase
MVRDGEVWWGMVRYGGGFKDDGLMEGRMGWKGGEVCNKAPH